MLKLAFKFNISSFVFIGVHFFKRIGKARATYSNPLVE